MPGTRSNAIQPRLQDIKTTDENISDLQNQMPCLEHTISVGITKIININNYSVSISNTGFG